MSDPLAIVDVETTGTSALYGRIIEIGIIRVGADRRTETFQTLINPECYIHPSIQGLTGISNEDVESAPTFSRVARRIFSMLDGAIFVAHNARFDYGFVKSEFARVGRTFTARCLCTMRLSRKLFPQHHRHDLSSIIERHGLHCEQRHRAMGDAEATHAFLEHIRGTVDPVQMDAAIRAVLKDGRFPPSLYRADLQSLPESPGVYLFYGNAGELLYVGKSRNVRSRVLDHFANDHRSAKEMEMCRATARVEARPTPGELGALLLESQLIKDLRPLYNTRSRRTRTLVLATLSTNRKGYAKVSIVTADRIDKGSYGNILGVFTSEKQAHAAIRRMAREHQLCHALLGLEKTRGYCFGYHVKQCLGACGGEESPASYNTRLEAAFDERRIHSWPFSGGILIEERRPGTDEGEAFLLDDWCLLSTVRYSEHGIDKRVAESHRFDYDTYKILLRYLRDASNKRNLRFVGRQEIDQLLCEE